MKKKHESSILTYSNKQSIKSRKNIYNMIDDYEGTIEEKERSLSLFIRGSSLARILAIAEVYKLIIKIPGCILDIGTWRGQTAVLCENFRAIYEPLNFNRRIYCFDTFTGYSGFSTKDYKSDLYKDKSYSLNGEKYAQFLNKLLIEHEKSNAMGHNNKKHKVIMGDVVKTIPKFFKDYPNQFISLAFIDINVYLPLKKIILNILDRLAPNGVLVFWQLTRESLMAEGSIYFEFIQNKYPHTLHQSHVYPGLCYIIKK